VEGFPFELVGGTDVLQGDVRGRLFLRIVAARVEPERFDAMRERYETEIVGPAQACTATAPSAA
jgi:hypothetical protein